MNMCIPLTYRLLELLSQVFEKTQSPLTLQAQLESSGYGYPSDIATDRALDALAQKGFIVYDHSATKRKFSTVKITDEGESAVKAVVSGYHTLLVAAGFKGDFE